MDSSIFGVLTMVENHLPGNNHQVSPYAIPKDADAGFLISGPLFLKNMMLEGAQAIFNDAPASSFEITNDYLTVQNTVDLIWGKFKLDNKKQGSVAASTYASQLDHGTIPQQLTYDLQEIGVTFPSSYTAQVTAKGSQWLLSDGTTDSDEYILELNGSNLDVWIATALTIAKGQFQMTLVDSHVEIEFVDVKYSYSSDFDVHVNYLEQVQLKLLDKAGKKVFWYDQTLKSMVVNVTKTKSAITREIVEGAITAVLALIVVAGPVLEGLATAGTEAAEITDEAGSVIIDAEEFTEAAAEDPLTEEESESEGAENAAEQSGGKLTSIKNAFRTPKWKFMAKLTALAGAVAGLDNAIDAIIEAAAKDKWENVPSFDAFANQAIAPYTFPNVPSFTLASAWLAGSLQVGLKVTPAA